MTTASVSEMQGKQMDASKMLLKKLFTLKERKLQETISFVSRVYVQFPV